MYQRLPLRAIAEYLNSQAFRSNETKGVFLRSSLGHNGFGLLSCLDFSSRQRQLCTKIKGAVTVMTVAVLTVADHDPIRGRDHGLGHVHNLVPALDQLRDLRLVLDHVLPQGHRLVLGHRAQGHALSRSHQMLRKLLKELDEHLRNQKDTESHDHTEVAHQLIEPETDKLQGTGLGTRIEIHILIAEAVSEPGKTDHVGEHVMINSLVMAHVIDHAMPLLEITGNQESREMRERRVK